jgi:uncharacterized membrane protein YcaP (DUF421 family)
MDPFRIALRVAFTFALVLILIRASGKRTIRQGNLSSFVVAVMLGDLFDDFFWAEVPASQLIVATGSVVTLHLVMQTGVTASGMRDWVRRRGGGAGA